MSNSGARHQTTYKVEYTSDAADFLAHRRAATHAAFALPYLRPGMRLLDCGCGPGFITADLAALVHPADVVGIDIDPQHIIVAQQLIAQRNLSTVRFELGDVTNLLS